MALKRFEKEKIKMPSKIEALKMAEESFTTEELFYFVKFKQLYPSGGLINAKSAFEAAKSNVLKKISVE